MEKTAKQIIEERIAAEETEQTIFSPEERQMLTNFAYQTNDTAAAQKLFTELATAGYGAAYGGFDPQLEERLRKEHPLYDGTAAPVTQSTEAVLPVLASIARQQEEKIEVLQDKIANLERKIERNENKIERLQNTAATLKKDTALLQGIAKRVPALAKALNVLISRNEQKITVIETEKIPHRQEKIQSHKQKIAKHEVKLAKAEKKLSRIMHLSSFLKNFTKLDKSERRESYIAGLTTLTCDMQERNERKQLKLHDRLESVEKQLQQTQGQDSESAEKRIGKDCGFPENVGIIIETPGFIPYYSGYKNLKLLADLNKKIDGAAVKKSMEQVGLDPNLKRHVRKYSLGMRQRLGLAQAIMENPDLLILDEPMNGLDKDGVGDMRKYLLNLKELGKTVLIASHSAEDIVVLCDTVCEMDKGVLTVQKQ